MIEECLVERVAAQHADEAAGFAREASALFAAAGPGTVEAAAFNERGSRRRTRLAVRLWGPSDPEDRPGAAYAVADSLAPGRTKAMRLPGTILAVYQQWFWWEDGIWYVTPRKKPEPVFGQNTYYREVAIFWFPRSGGGLDDVALGGLVHDLPETKAGGG